MIRGLKSLVPPPIFQGRKRGLDIELITIMPMWWSLHKNLNYGAWRTSGLTWLHPRAGRVAHPNSTGQKKVLHLGPCQTLPYVPPHLTVLVSYPLPSTSKHVSLSSVSHYSNYWTQGRGHRNPSLQSSQNLGPTTVTGVWSQGQLCGTDSLTAGPVPTVSS